MKHVWAILISMAAMLGFAAALSHFYPLQASSEPQLTQARNPTLWVTSDTHFIAPSLHDNKSAWRYIESTAAGKDMADQPVAISAFVKAAVHAHPTAVIITGDVTFNGELISAQSLAKRLAPIQKAGIHLLVVPGNHDIYDGWARQYKGQDQLKTTQIGPNDWRDIFADGYANDASEDGDSLSYAVNLNQDYQLLMLDDNIYTIQPANIQPTTGGRLRESTLQWIRTRLEKAKAQGRTTLVFMHHNLYVHSSHVSSGWVLDNAAALRKLLDAYQVPVVFSGHIHAQDIAADPDGRYATKEIVSASFSETPGIYGVVDLTKNQFHYHTAKQNLQSVLTASSPKRLDNYPAYLETMFKDTQALPIVFQEAKEAGLKGADLRNASNFLAELNWRFFSGNDSGDLTTLKKMAGYKLVMGNPKLRQRAQGMLQDHNLPDHRLTLNY